MCYERLFQWAQAEADARKVIELKPDFAKGHVRLVKALVGANKSTSEIGAAIANGKEAVQAKDLDGLEAEVSRVTPCFRPAGSCDDACLHSGCSTILTLHIALCQFARMVPRVVD